MDCTFLTLPLPPQLVARHNNSNNNSNPSNVNSNDDDDRVLNLTAQEILLDDQFRLLKYFPTSNSYRDAQAKLLPTTIGICLLSRNSQTQVSVYTVFTVGDINALNPAYAHQIVHNDISSIPHRIFQLIQNLPPAAVPYRIHSISRAMYFNNQTGKKQATEKRMLEIFNTHHPPISFQQVEKHKATKKRRTEASRQNILLTSDADYELLQQDIRNNPVVYANVRVKSCWNCPDPINNPNTFTVVMAKGKPLSPLETAIDRTSFVVIEACNLASTGHFFVFDWQVLEEQNVVCNTEQPGSITLDIVIPDPANQAGDSHWTSQYYNQFDSLQAPIVLDPSHPQLGAILTSAGIIQAPLLPNDLIYSLLDRYNRQQLIDFLHYFNVNTDQIVRRNQNRSYYKQLLLETIQARLNAPASAAAPHPQ
jgi:hypothetical protein